ncbi:MAG: hypothetical protein HKN67_09835 [Saprospiraceae bacterium]|nr:hypothetical protein [Bacteroidia bacterium]MBT8230644.1 hypothetical protein [Bacteroidia bacterium]NNF22233.1 hypothetical protein [Saprospiraceae bacterium]
MNNSFKELEKIQEEQFKNNLRNVKNSMDGNLEFISQFTHIIDLYFSKLMDLFVNWSGGSSDKPEK